MMFTLPVKVIVERRGTPNTLVLNMKQLQRRIAIRKVPLQQLSWLPLPRVPMR